MVLLSFLNCTYSTSLMPHQTSSISFYLMYDLPDTGQYFGITIISWIPFNIYLFFLIMSFLKYVPNNLKLNVTMCNKHKTRHDTHSINCVCVCVCVWGIVTQWKFMKILSSPRSRSFYVPNFSFLISFKICVSKILQLFPCYVICFKTIFLCQACDHVPLIKSLLKLPITFRGE